ncbi:hypothetical protein TI39_contig4297g00011 [Zymoseptoria brevis]|uniref:Uncharacterized protein n=1 Tax=Zymoseptoria brevis TaxID=1047168 RepID=A0A0F4GBH7_9PEZI|nr:hypothetical protein TI39_contig4297g00011 [Zymoseptoria brevis]
MPSLLQELVAHSTPDNTPCTYQGPLIGYCVWAWHPNPNGTIFSYSNIKTVRPAFAQMCQEEHCWYYAADTATTSCPTAPDRGSSRTSCFYLLDDSHNIYAHLICADHASCC